MVNPTRVDRERIFVTHGGNRPRRSRLMPTTWQWADAQPSPTNGAGRNWPDKGLPAAQRCRRSSMAEPAGLASGLPAVCPFTGAGHGGDHAVTLGNIAMPQKRTASPRSGRCPCPSGFWYERERAAARGTTDTEGRYAEGGPQPKTLIAEQTICRALVGCPGPQRFSRPQPST